MWILPTLAANIRNLAKFHLKYIFSMDQQQPALVEYCLAHPSIYMTFTDIQLIHGSIPVMSLSSLICWRSSIAWIGSYKPYSVHANLCSKWLWFGALLQLSFLSDGFLCTPQQHSKRSARNVQSTLRCRALSFRSIAWNPRMSPTINQKRMFRVC